MRYVNIGLHKLWNAIRCKEQTEYVDENDEVIDAPDYYFEINFAQLTKEYKVQKLERQKYTKLKDNDHFTPEQVTQYVDKYISMMKRNEKDIYDRIVELADKHIDLCEGSENIFLQEEKIKAVKTHYTKATDWDNPNRDKYKITDEMNGRIVGNVMSYVLMDNEKYHEIEELLEVMEYGDQEDTGLKRASTFAGMGSYYQRSKTFAQGPASPSKTMPIQEL